MPAEQSNENEEVDEVDGVKFTPWDRRVIAAIDVAEGARGGVLFLRASAVVVAVFAIVGSALSYFSDFESGGTTFENEINRQTVGQFLAGVSGPLAFAGIVLGLSYLVQISAARLNIDIVLSDEDEMDTDE